jgi:hypothetical protein
MCACMCVPGEGRRVGGKDLSRVRTCYREKHAHSRFKGVSGAFQTGTMSTFGREVNWKSMGASVDRSDLGRWAIEVSRWPANTRRED